MTAGTEVTHFGRRATADLRILEFAFLCAGANWSLWLADFTFAGDRARLPVLSEADRFTAFCNEYRPLRGIKQQTQEAIRQWLLGSERFRNAVEDDSGTGIDELALHLREAFGLDDTRLSLVSKLAAFARPRRFVAWDQFARKGVSLMRYGRRSSNHTNYQGYLHDVNHLWEGALGEAIRSFVERNAPPFLESDEALGKRVLDVYLMITGGRWKTQLSLPGPCSPLGAYHECSPAA